MPKLAHTLPTDWPRKLAKAPGSLGVVALAATLLFTINGTSAAGAADYSELPAIQSVTEITALDDAAGTLAYRTQAASRAETRMEPVSTEIPTNLSWEVPEFAPQFLETSLDGEFLPVAVTPAPIWCSFTGLGHLPETHELCAHPSNNTPEQNRALGEYLTGLRGWVGEQWQCMDNLMTRESRWRHNAANPVTAARGIPQKMMSVHYGANWRTSDAAAAWMSDPEAQIEWGLNYIDRRYNTPCGAWAFFQRNGWY